MNEFWISLGLAELPILDFIRTNIACPFLDAIMPFISMICDHGEIWIAAALIMLLLPKYRRTGLSTAIALILGLLIVNLIMKPAFARIRPYDLVGVDLIIKSPSDYSFPSGHTLSCFEAFGAMIMTNKKIGLAALIPALLISFSRLYLYVHYPTDVIAAALLGLLFAFIGVKLADLIINKTGGLGTSK